MDKIRVLIVDDHEVVRLGLRTALEAEDDVEVVGDVGDAAAALREAEATHPNVVLMDVRMPGVDGIEACRMLHDRIPEVRVVMLTSYSDQKAVFASIMAGAAGYLLKNTGRAELLKAVRAAANNQSLLDPSVTPDVFERIRDITRDQEDRERAILSAREKEVLILVTDGLTNKQIASALIISENTVRNHVSNIFDKLGVGSQAAATKWAVENGLADVDQPEEI